MTKTRKINAASSAHSVLAFALVPWVAVVAAGCQSVIGLDTPHLSADAAVDASLGDAAHDHADGAADAGADFDASPAIVAACSSFCDDVDSVCNGKIGPQAYPRTEACHDVCLHYDHLSTATLGPTFACRRARADSVVPLIGSEAAEGKAISAYCAMLSVGGEDDSRTVDDPSCGTNCDNYCQLRQELCGVDRPLETCVAQCGTLIDTGGVNAGQDFDTHPDSVQCRLAHLSMAATPNGAVHCEHSRLNPIRDPDPVTGKPTGLSCDLGDDVSRGDLCDNYCHLVTRICTADNEAVWKDEAECLRACKNPNSLDLGQLSDHAQDSWGCRRTHTYIALEEQPPKGVPKSHCSHASIGGGGDHCGGNACDVYCNLLSKNCKTDFDGAFPGGQANCVEKCGDFQGVQQGGKSARYSLTLGLVPGDSYACRLHALVGVLAGDATSCPAAVGGRRAVPRLMAGKVCTRTLL